MLLLLSRPCPARNITQPLPPNGRTPYTPRQHEWGKRAKIQFKSVLRVNWLLGLHDLVDEKQPLDSFDRSEAEKYGLGTERTAEQYWEWAKVKPGRSSDKLTLPDWSESHCKEYSNGGMVRIPTRSELAARPAGAQAQQA